MLTIFYDLETSDRNLFGQILSYSFVVLDQDWSSVAELRGTISISPLQLPTAGAILANRINVQQHQQSATDGEYQAMLKIAEFFRELTRNGAQRVGLLGYNSSRFDLPFLRTSLIRNGFEPYYRGALVSRDAFLCSRKLAVSMIDFPRPRARDKENRLSLTLESIATELGLLTGAQSHDSHEDVLLLINLCRYYQQHFGLDPRTFVAYEATPFHNRSSDLKIVERLEPNYDLTSESRFVATPMVNHDFDGRQALWINLKRFSEKRERSAIRRFGIKTEDFFLGESYPADHELLTVAKAGREFFADLTVNNFFEDTNCDIEQHIYRLTFDDIDCLGEAIREGSLSPLKQILIPRNREDASVLYMRNRLANRLYGEGDQDQYREGIRKFALRRYGGKAQIAKHLDDDVEGESKDYFPTFKELWEELDRRLTAAVDSEDRELLLALKAFYIESEIYQVAGMELLAPAVL